MLFLCLTVLGVIGLNLGIVDGSKNISRSSDVCYRKNTNHSAADQLCDFKESQNGQSALLTESAGRPVGDKLNALTVGPRGPILLQDTVFIDLMSHFNRERIPERVVHAKGAGAFGYFEVTNDITNYTKAIVFSKVGKTTPIVVRFSTVGGESGSADTSRDPRGFAIKFYTEEGNWDLMGLDGPIFFIRDPLLFPVFIHTQKRNPVTHLPDPNMFWDFMGLRPETTHEITYLFSDRGIPDGYRHMNGYGANTYKLVNADGKAVYCKFHYKTEQGIKNLSAEDAERLAGSDPDYSTRDLYNAIDAGDFPAWRFYIQVMTFEQAEKFEFNPFDVTKVWGHEDYPLIPVGRLVLNRNPSNYFADVEQVAFAPSHLVPGIEPSQDKLLQGRLFAYPDAHNHRLGPNSLQIPVNCPFKANVKIYQRDGQMTVNDNQGGAPNYYPNSFNGPLQNSKYIQTTFETSGDVARYDSSDEDNFTQPGLFYRDVLDDGAKDRLVNNICNSLIGALYIIQDRAVKNFEQADSNYGRKVRECLDKKKRKRAHK